jgi:transketolase
MLSNPNPLNDLAFRVRRQTLFMVNRAKSSHVGTCFSMAELLAVLYGKELRVDPERPDWPERDRFILSKGHGAAALYAVLAEKGFFPKEWIQTFYQNGSRLAGPRRRTRMCRELRFRRAHWGSGLSVATGMALAAKRDGRGYRGFALLSDGECDEGSTLGANPVRAATQARQSRSHRRLQQDPEPWQR